MGNRDASAESFDFHFKGQKTIEAALATLVKEHGLGAKPGQTLLFGGGSAGGRGAMANLDFIDGILSERLHVASAPRVLGFPDSPYWMDLVPDRAASPPDKFIGFAKMTADIFALGNISGRASAACAATYSGEDAWKCAFGQYRMPFITTPYMMVASQSDAFQLGADIGHLPKTKEEKAYAQTFATATHTHGSALVAAGTKAAKDGSVVFSQNCHTHSTSLSDYGMSGKKNGFTVRCLHLEQDHFTMTGSGQTYT